MVKRTPDQNGEEPKGYTPRFLRQRGSIALNSAETGASAISGWWGVGAVGQKSESQRVVGWLGSGMMTRRGTLS